MVSIVYYAVRSRLSLSLTYQLYTLWKHAYSNILRILPPKYKNFQMKKSGSFHIFAQNIDCLYSLEPPRRGGSNEYPQSMFLSRNKNIIVFPFLNLSFTV